MSTSYKQKSSVNVSEHRSDLDSNETTAADEDVETKWIKTTRRHLDNPSFQVMILLFIYLDIILGATQHAADSDVTTTLHLEPIRAFILYIHAIELIVQMTLINRYFSNMGYMLDTVLIGTRLVGMPHSHLTGFLRVWRLFHLVETYISIETQTHTETKHELSRQLRIVGEFEKKVQTMESDLAHEKLLSEKNRDITKECQDEIETLREALRIAAIEVAAATAIQGQEIEMLDAPNPRC